MESDWLADRFEEHRAHLRAVAYRTLGSLSEAGDAVQETWLRLSRSDASAVQNLGGWLTTIVARVCLNMMSSGQSRREEPAGADLPEPPRGEHPADPEQQALLADSVGLALTVVLEALVPAERLAFAVQFGARPKRPAARRTWLVSCPGAPAGPGWRASTGRPGRCGLWAGDRASLSASRSPAARLLLST
jgi:Sigma-70 region 2